MHQLVLFVLSAVVASVMVDAQGFRAPVAESMASGSFLTADRRRGQDMCHYNHGSYRHGQEFSLPGSSNCIRYICWYGDVHMREEGCEVGGQCHRINSDFEYNCSRYYCRKTVDGGFYRYEPLLQSSRCKDSNGRCRNPGDRFPFVMRGRYYNDCTCSVGHNNLRYSCTRTYRPGK